jgi:hypothetical protein
MAVQITHQHFCPFHNRLLGYSVAQHEETVRIAGATTKDAE